MVVPTDHPTVMIYRETTTVTWGYSVVSPWRPWKPGGALETGRRRHPLPPRCFAGKSMAVGPRVPEGPGHKLREAIWVIGYIIGYIGCWSYWEYLLCLLQLASGPGK